MGLVLLFWERSATYQERWRKRGNCWWKNVLWGPRVCGYHLGTPQGWTSWKSKGARSHPQLRPLTLKSPWKSTSQTTMDHGQN